MQLSSSRRVKLLLSLLGLSLCVLLWSVTATEAQNVGEFHSHGTNVVPPGGAGGGSGSVTTIKIGGTQLGGADIEIIDFDATDFSGTESPDKEVNITIDDDGHAHTTTSISALVLADDLDTFSSANLTGRLTDEDGSGLCAAGLICTGGHEHAGANLTDDVFLLDTGDVGTGVYDFGGADSLELVNSATPTTDATGEIALDTTITDHQPLYQYFDGGENMTLIAIDTAQLPALDNEIVKYDAAADKFVLEADASGGTTAFDDISDPDNSAESEIIFNNATETATFSYTAAFGNVDNFVIQQETGNPTDGTLLALITGDANVDVLTAGDGTNETVIQDDGKQVYTGTAQPKHRLFLGINAGSCRTDNGCTDSTKRETTTNKVIYWASDFEATNDDFWQFHLTMPENWDAGTITAAVQWTGTTQENGTVVWGVQCMTITDDDVLDTAFGTAVTVSDDITVTGDLQETAETSAITCSGSPAAGHELWGQVYRDPDNASDDATNVAAMLGVWIVYGVDALSTED